VEQGLEEGLEFAILEKDVAPAVATVDQRGNRHRLQPLSPRVG
jgi:hypothetical protein